MEPLTTAPDTTTFVPIAEHQSRTPSSFYSGPAVLHYHQQNCSLVVLERDLAAVPALAALRDTATTPATANGHTTDDAEETEVVIPGVSVWVTSDKFLLYNPTTPSPSGLSIPYPSISLHAIQRLHLPNTESQVQGLYMQIATPTPNPASIMSDDEEESLTLTLVPPPASSPSPSNSATSSDLDSSTPAELRETPTQTLYAAVSACSNLHPDPVEDGDDDEEGDNLFQSGLVTMGDGAGGLPPPVEGSGGWITAENMHEFFDEEGNWIGGGEEPSLGLNLGLGPGAGTVRAREDEDENEMDVEGGEEGVDGQGEGGETKWRRTD
ncbi:hypothetical protein BO70DRAFT_307071, partial [Aspergillus heteromorphus CBS 117.55]